MVLLSSGALVKTPSTLWEGTTDRIPGWVSDRIISSSYTAMYRRQLWVYTLVNKIGNATARLPLKVYRRTALGREIQREDAYARLIARPHPSIDPYLFWLWVASTKEVYGEAFLRKRRDGLGRTVALDPVHPTLVVDQVDGDGNVSWFVGTKREQVARRDLVHFATYSADTLTRGTSPLEPLRSTLENEEGARRANSAMWRNGARPSVALKHPKALSEDAQTRLRSSWQLRYGGVDNWGMPAILEEGMEAQILSLNAEELQYVDARKLNREEACAAFDVPPPVVHILDKATFSNITEQMRSMYRDTMAPKLGLIESVLDSELRDGRMGVGVDPEFSDDLYAEFLLDEVLRGDFETRSGAIGTMIQTGQLTPAEAREMENRPFIEGTDQLFINAAVVPLDMADNVTPGAASARSIIGRLSRAETVHDLDESALLGGLNDTAAVSAALADARAANTPIAEFRVIVKELLA